VLRDIGDAAFEGDLAFPGVFGDNVGFGAHDVEDGCFWA